MDDERDDERDAPAYEFSGGESSGGSNGDSGEDEKDQNVVPDEERMADTDGEPTGDPPGDRSAPPYAFGKGESSGDDDAPLEGGKRREAGEYDFGGGESSGEADEDADKAPATAAMKTPHGDFTAKHRSEREQAKAEREAKEAEAEQRDRRKSRLKKVGIALAVAAVIVLIAIVVSTGGGEATRKGGEQEGPTVGAAAIDKRFAGIPQSGLTLGDPKAPVTIVEFADLQCPFCKQAADGSLPTLIDKYVRPGKLRIEFRNFPILGPDSEKAARALEGAADQNKAWQFLDLWYLNQGEENTGYVTDEFIRRIAGGVKGLDAQKVVDAVERPGQHRVDRDRPRGRGEVRGGLDAVVPDRAHRRAAGDPHAPGPERPEPVLPADRPAAPARRSDRHPPAVGHRGPGYRGRRDRDLPDLRPLRRRQGVLRRGRRRVREGPDLGLRGAGRHPGGGARV